MLSTVLFWISVGVYALLVVGTVLAVMLENRQPERTVAWILTIVLLPIVGLVCFYFFGQNIRQKRRRRKYYRKNSRSLHQTTPSATAPESSPNTATPHPFAPLQHLCADEFDAPLQTLGDITLFDTGNAFFEHLKSHLVAARHHIYIETYIIEDDKVGRSVSETLIAAVRRGVEVRLMYDDVGCWRVPARFFQQMKAQGVKVEPFMPVRFPSLTHKINYRNHRKICVIDDEIGYLGGMNLAERYCGTPDRVWRDLQVALEGTAVVRLKEIFLADWSFVAGDSPQATPVHYAPLPTAAQPTLQIVTSNPLTPVPQLMTAYIWAAMHARKYLYVQTPYFMPTETFLLALKSAALTGVDVRVMLPVKPDGIMLRHINDSYVAELLAAGIRVYLYQAGFLHSKCIVVDDQWCAIGSANMDFRSFLNNIEVSVLVYDADTSATVRGLFERDAKQCREIDAKQWAARPWTRKLKESATRILSPLF